MNSLAPNTPRFRLRSDRIFWLLLPVGILVYSNSLRVPFVFDDKSNIVENRSIEHIESPSRVLGRTQRPVVNLTLAINYAVGGRRVFGYHVANLAIHLAAALALYGVVHRLALATASAGLTDADNQADGWAAELAFSVALIWLVHPLQTQAVTYIIQRAESLAALCYLFTLYCVIRSIEAARGAGWSVAAILVCAVGMGTKRVIISAPLVAMLVDRTFYAGSFAVAVRRRWPLYLGLVGTWTVVLTTVGIGRIFHGRGTVGFGSQGVFTVTWLQYALSQPGVILHYLRLIVWPHPLCFDYGWPPAETAGQIVLPTLAIGLLLAGTGVALWRRSWLGVAGASFLILAPTSSIMPIADLAVEHRMYPALAPVLVILIVYGRRLLLVLGDRSGRVSTVLLVVTALLLGGLTWRRNQDYRSRLALWRTVVLTAPHHYRGYNNLGRELLEHGQVDLAIQSYRRALKLRPGIAEGHANLGRALSVKATRLATDLAKGDDAARRADAQRAEDGSIAEFRSALEVKPDLADTQSDLGMALARQGKTDEAIEHYRRALELAPKQAITHGNLGAALASKGELDEALRHFRRAVQLTPKSANAHRNLGSALKMTGRHVEARQHLDEARRLARERP